MAPHLLSQPALTITGAAAPGRIGGAGSADPRASRPRGPSRTFFCSSPSRGRRGLRRRKGLSVAAAAEGAEPGGPAGPMRLNEYMVAVDRPLGVRFALGVDGRVFVHSLRKGGNAEKSRIIMVGDTLKKAGGDGEGLVTIKDLGDTEYGISVSLVQRLA